MASEIQPKLVFFLTIGWISFALGLVGIFLPILPTAPFMILAAACFDRGSPRFHAWIVNHRIFGPPIQDWRRNRAIRPKYKAIAGVTMGGSIVLVWFMDTIPLAGKISYAFLLTLVFGYIVSRKNK